MATPPPIIPALPPAPNRNDAPADFSTKADTFVAALPPMVTKENELAAWQNALAIEMTSQVSAAAGSATAAAGSATAADTSKTAAQTAAQTAQIAAAAAGASAGIGQLGNPGDSLQVNAARTGLVFGPTDGKVGDVLISARSPGPLFVPASGGIRAQSALPSLLGVLGLLGGQVGQQYATVTAGSLTGAVDIASAPNPNGGLPLVMLINAGVAIYFSSDGGATWVNKTTANGTSPVSIRYDEANSLWLVTYSNSTQISYSSDNGGTWTLTPASGVLPTGISKIVADANGVWLATGVAASTSVYRSTDKGLTWTAIATGASAIHTAISTDNKGVWCVTAGSTVRRSVDGGLTWAVQFTASSTQNAISNDRNGVWMISGLTSNSNTYKSVDNGLTWTLLATPVTSTVTDIAYSQGFFFLVRNVSPQLIMISAAADATVYTVPTAAVLASLIKVTATAGYVVAVNSANTTVLRSAPIFAYDPASQLQLPNFPVAPGLQAWVKAGLAMLSSGKAFTVGSTVDTTSTRIETDGSGTMVALGGTTIRRSTDFGATWTAVSNPSGASLFSVVTNRKGLWIIGGSQTILRSTDNGLTFAPVPSANHGFAGVGVGPIVIGRNDVMVGCPLSAVIPPRKSSDGGLTWTSTGLPSLISKVATDNVDNWLVAQGSNVYSSTDNAVSFGSAIATGLAGTLADIVMTEGGAALVTGSTLTAKLSSDSGATWPTSAAVPLTNMLLKNGPGKSVLGYNSSHPQPYVSPGLQATGLGFVIGIIFGTLPTGISDATNGKYSPFVLLGVYPSSRSLIKGTLDTPV